MVSKERDSLCNDAFDQLCVLRHCNSQYTCSLAYEGIYSMCINTAFVVRLVTENANNLNIIAY